MTTLTKTNKPLLDYLATITENLIETTKQKIIRQQQVTRMARRKKQWIKKLGYK